MTNVAVKVLISKFVIRIRPLLSILPKRKKYRKHIQHPSEYSTTTVESCRSPYGDCSLTIGDLDRSLYRNMEVQLEVKNQRLIRLGTMGIARLASRRTADIVFFADRSLAYPLFRGWSREREARLHCVDRFFRRCKRIIRRFSLAFVRAPWPSFWRDISPAFSVFTSTLTSFSTTFSGTFYPALLLFTGTEPPSLLSPPPASPCTWDRKKWNVERKVRRARVLPWTFGRTFAV